MHKRKRERKGENMNQRKTESREAGCFELSEKERETLDVQLNCDLNSHKRRERDLGC